MKNITAHKVLYGAALSILLCIAAFSGKASAAAITLVTYGDSLSAGFGLEEGQAFPAQLEIALKAKGHDVSVINASVSGDTTAAGLKRFDWSFPDKADGVILELGANDALRGLKPEVARENLDQLLVKIKQKGAVPLLTGMLAPRNMGARYTKEFDAIFPELAKKHDVLLYPFFLFDVVGKKELNLPDGLHPNAKGVKEIVRQILPKAEELLQRIAARQVKTQ